jgi:tetratricopeptide (TPR) repeat protein
MLADADHQTESGDDRAHFLAKAVATVREALTAFEDGKLDGVKQNSNNAKRLSPILTNLACRFATADDPKLRDPKLAVELANKAIEFSPDSSYNWQVLGWAYYRNGEWQKTIEAMEKAVELQRNTGDPDQWFFLAMAHWQLGNQQQARQWYDKSIADMGTSSIKQRLRYRSEAEELMGLNTPVVAPKPK